MDDAPVPSSVRESMSSLYLSYQRQSIMSAGQSSAYSDSDGASWLGSDEAGDSSALLSPYSHSAYRNMHLPRGSLPLPPLDDTHSLSTSTSYSSLRTPSTSRTTSVAMGSPPISPTNSPHPRSNDALSPRFANPDAYAKLLGTINETRHHTEDVGQQHGRHPSETADTIILHDGVYVADHDASPRPSGQYSRQQRSDSRSDTHSPLGSVYSGIERSPAPSVSRSPLPVQAQASSSARRLPADLQKLRIVTTAPSPVPPPAPASAPTPELGMTSPFNQQQHRIMQRAPLGAQMHAYASPAATASASYTPDHLTRSYSQDSQMQQMQMHHQQLQAQQAQQQQQNAEKLPHVPLSPIASTSSGSSASRHSMPATTKSRAGFGKLFGRGNKDKGHDKDNKDKASSHRSSELTTASTPSTKSSHDSVHSGDSLDRADEKRLKKEAARARTERLAQDLAEKAKRRAEEAKALKAGRVREKTAKPWEEGGGMYEGISYF